MSTSNDTTVYIYVLQRISDKAFLYIGSAKNPKERFYRHQKTNPYPVIRAAFTKNDIRFLVITNTDELHRIEVEHNLWVQFIESGHPIVNIDPALTTYEYGHSSWNKGIPVLEKTRAAIIAAHKGKPRSAEVRAKISQGRKGIPMRPETKAKLSEINKNKKLSDITKAKMSKARKGKPGRKGRKQTEEEKQRRSISLKGHIVSESTRGKISRARRHFSSLQDQQIYQLYLDGLTQLEIAKTYNVSQSCISCSIIRTKLSLNTNKEK